MIRRVLVALGSFVLAIAVALGLTFIRPAQMPEPVVIELPYQAKVTCPVPGKALVAGSEEAHVVPLSGGQESPLAVPGEVDLTGPADLRASAPVVAGVLTGEVEGFVSCAAPVSTGIVIVPDPSSTELLLVNSDPNEAAVDLTLLGPAGEVAALGARGIAMAGSSTSRSALSVLAPEGPVGVVFSASVGRVALIATSIEGLPTSFAAPGVLATTHLIAGLPSQGSATQLLVSNPYEDRLQIRVTAMGGSSTFTPASAEDISVPARATVAVDLGSDLAGEASALQVTSTAEFGAAVVTTLDEGPPSNLSDSVVSAKLGAFVPAREGSVMLTNPGEAEVTASVSIGAAEPVSVVVPPGRTITVPVPETGGAVQVSASGPVAGGVVSGSLVIPLGLTEVPETITGSAVLDPGLR